MTFDSSNPDTWHAWMKDAARLSGPLAELEGDDDDEP